MWAITLAPKTTNMCLTSVDFVFITTLPKLLHYVHYYTTTLLNYNMSSSPSGCCAVQWAMWKGGGLTSRDRLNSSENYLRLGFLLAMPSQTVLLLVRQSVT